ncbi:MAG: sulfatase-like hydrolase/transferase [Gaiellales bacterium]
MANLLLIVVDCLRADALARGRGAWPRISRLAGRSARFTACYSTCPTTTPAVTAILTGRYPSAHGVRGLRGTQLSEAIPTAAEQLTQGGLATWCSATGPLLDTVGTFRGFGDVEYRDVPRRSVHSPWGRESVTQLAQLASAGTRFFALVHLWDAHTPRSYPARFENRSHGRNAYERSIAGMDEWIGAAVDAAGPDTIVVLTGDHGENVTFEPRSLRDQAVWRRINRRLPIARWAEATVDHGVRSHSKRALRWAPRYFWNHGQTLEEALVRVPLVVAGPGIVPGSRRTPVSHVDVAPTLVDLAGAPHPDAGWQGQSLAAALCKGGEPAARPVAMEIAVAPSIPAIRQQAIRDGRHKLITSFDDERVTDALYDLDADPGERRNLILTAPAEADRLRETLRTLVSERAEAVAMGADDDAEIAERLRELGYL